MHVKSFGVVVNVFFFLWETFKKNFWGFNLRERASHFDFRFYPYAEHAILKSGFQSLRFWTGVTLFHYQKVNLIFPGVMHADIKLVYIYYAGHYLNWIKKNNEKPFGDIYLPSKQSTSFEILFFVALFLNTHFLTKLIPFNFTLCTVLRYLSFNLLP